MPKRKKYLNYICVAVLCMLAPLFVSCGKDKPAATISKSVPHEGRWGIYALTLSSQDIALLYSTNDEIAGLDLSHDGTHLAFSKKNQIGVDIDTTSEIYSLNLGGSDPVRLTSNYYFDSYPSFSPGDSQIVFISLRDNTLDLFVMDSNGTDQHLLYNSGGHDADVNWGNGGRIAFTRDWQIWSIKGDGTDPKQVTNPLNAGTWGAANLPIGDYDPRTSPDGNKIAFERMVDVSYIHGGYDIYTISANGSNETALTSTGSLGYAQGFPNWSHTGDKIVYILSAIDTQGKYDLCMMNSDGSANHVITPGYFPALFLCHNAVFSLDDTKIYFIGEWWQ